MIGGPDSVFPLLAHALDICALRQSVHTANIANANVEGYRRLKVDFEGALARAVGAENPFATTFAEADFGAPQVVSTHEAVKLDQEMASMAQNALRYQMLVNAFERATGSIRLAIREGRE